MQLVSQISFAGHLDTSGGMQHQNMSFTRAAADVSHVDTSSDASDWQPENIPLMIVAADVSHADTSSDVSDAQP
jgi:hypothetical protein